MILKQEVLKAIYVISVLIKQVILIDIENLLFHNTVFLNTI